MEEKTMCNIINKLALLLKKTNINYKEILQNSDDFERWYMNLFWKGKSFQVRYNNKKLFVENSMSDIEELAYPRITKEIKNFLNFHNLQKLNSSSAYYGLIALGISKVLNVDNCYWDDDYYEYLFNKPFKK